MTWAALAITVMTRQVLPSWRATAVVGLLTGLAIATRTGGIITHAYLLGAMILCVGEFWVRNARVTPRYIMQITMRYAAVVVIAWVVAIALWPWLQTGNPWQQFKVALVHFATIPMSYEFSHGANGYGPMGYHFPTFRLSCWPGCRKRFCSFWPLRLSSPFMLWSSSRVKRGRHGASTAMQACEQRC